VNDSHLISDVELSKYSFDFLGKEVSLYLTSEELKSMSLFFNLINSSEHTWEQSKEIVTSKNPYASYIIDALNKQYKDDLVSIQRDYKIKKILKSV
jgi:hypothetical protein